MKTAVFTMVRNESEFLPLWLSYYSRFFDSLYVLDDLSTDETIKECKKKYKFEVVPLRQHDFSYLERRVMVVRQEQVKLLSQYDWVLYTDADEIIIVDMQKFTGLREYINQLRGNSVTCTGRDLIQSKKEKAIDFSIPILPQREKWVDTIPSYKTLLSRVPLNWTKGFHSVEEARQPDSDARRKMADPDLVLVHLFRVDFGLYQKRSLIKRGIEYYHQDEKKAVKVPKRFWGAF